MDEPINLPAEVPPVPVESDQLRLYGHIYELSRRDYRTLRMRTFARKSLVLVILLLAGAGVFFSVFYFVFLRSRISSLREQLVQSLRRIGPSRRKRHSGVAPTNAAS